MPFCLVQIFQWVYKSQLVLRPESGSFPMWQDLPAPLIASIYIFNVTNSQQVRWDAFRNMRQCFGFGSADSRGKKRRNKYLRYGS